MKGLQCLLFCCFVFLGVVHAQAPAPQEDFEEDVEWNGSPVVVRMGAVLPNGVDAEMLRKGYELFSEVSGASEWQIEWLDGSSSPIRFDFVSLEGGGEKRDHYEKVVQLIEGEKVDFLMGSLPKYACGEAGLAAARKVVNVQCCTVPAGEFNCDLPGFWMRAPVTDVVGPAVRSMILQGMHRLGLLYDDNSVRSKSMCASTVLKLVRDLGDVDNGLELMVEQQLDASNKRKDVIDKFARDCKDKEVEAVLACCEKEDCSHVLHALHQIKHPLKATFLMDGPVDTAWLSEFPLKHIRDIMTSAVWHESAKLSSKSFGSLKKFRQMYKDYYNTTEEPRHDTASAFSAGLVLITAIKKAMATCSLAHGSVSTYQLLHNSSSLSCMDGGHGTGYERIVDILSKIEIDTLDGPIKFNWKGRNSRKSPVIVQIRKRAGTGGTLVPFTSEVVLPLEYATANIKIPASNPYRKNCSAGYYMSEDEFDPCIKCPPGMISRTINAHHCDSCTLTEWMDQPGAKKCNQCPPHTRVSERGATNLTDCLCQESFFHPLSEPGQECSPCVSGSWCPGGVEPPIPLKGYWADQMEKTWVHPCKQRESCLGGKESECAEGYTGRLCAECQAGYFQFVDHCWKCMSKFSIICFIIILILGWYILNVVISRNVSSLDMLLGFAQMVNIVGDVNLNWPSMLSSVVGIANLLDFDVDILEPTCLFPGWSFSHNLIVQLTLPLLMGSMAHFGYLASWSVLRLQKGKGPHLRMWIARAFPWIVSIPENEKQLKEKWDSTIAAYLAAVDITFVTVTKYTYEAFQCEKIGGKMVMSADTSTECGTTAHKAAMALASIGILIYTVGYLSFIIWKLLTMWSRKTFSDPCNLRRYGFLYRRFEPDYFWMSIMIMIRRVGFVCALVFIRSPAYQAGGLALIINASLMLHVYTAPYVDTYLDVLYSFLLVALMFVTFGGVMFYSDQLSIGERDLLEGLTLAVFGAIVLVFLVIFANEVIRMYKIHVLKKLHLDFVMSNISASEEDSEAPGKSRNHAKKHAKSQVSHELLETFDPNFLHKALIGSHSNAQNWDHLTHLLKDYMSDQSETSYLSMRQVAKFWRKLVDRFPELVDFLALADDTARNHFREFANCLYVDFFLKKKLDDSNIFDVLNWRDRAPLAQWLAHCGKHDRAFFTTFMGNMIRQAEGEEKYAMYLQRMQSCGRHLPVRTTYLHARPRSRRDPNSSGDSKRFPLSLSEVMVYVSSRDPEAIEEEIRNGNGPLFHSASTGESQKYLHHDERKSSQSLSKEIP